MITIEKTDIDGTIHIDFEQIAYEDLFDLYCCLFAKEMRTHDNEDIATGAALMSTIEYAINVFMFENKCIRPLAPPKKD